MSTEKLKQLLEKKIAHDATMMCAPYLRSMISRTVSEEYCINIGNSLAEYVLKLAEALERIKDARFNNPNQEMGDLLLYKSAVSEEALNELYKDLGGLE